MAERCVGSDVLCDDDRAVRQVCPGCGFETDTVEETWTYSLGRPVRRRRFDTHWVLTGADASLADFVNQLRAG